MRIVTIRPGLALGLMILGLCIPATGRAEPVTIFGHPFCCGSIAAISSHSFCLSKKSTCSKPLCDPCQIQNNGYYPTCWSTWKGRTDCPCPNAPPLPYVPKSSPKTDGQSDTNPDKTEKEDELAPPPTKKPMKDPDKDPEKDPSKDS